MFFVHSFLKSLTSFSFSSFSLDLRQDFVLGILGSEVLHFKIHVHVIEEEYAARVRSLSTYAAVSRDIINRWTYPLVPDSNISGYMWENSSYSYTRPNIYKEEDILLARSCIIGTGCVLGRSTKIGESSTIQRSVLGRDCIIGNHVTIIDSYLWGKVTVEDNCIIRNSIICNRVLIRMNTTIDCGCLVSFDSIIGPDISLDRETKITCHSLKDFHSFDSPTKELDIGEDGKGFLWVYDEGDPTNSLSKKIFFFLFFLFFFLFFYFRF